MTAIDTKNVATIPTGGTKYRIGSRKILTEAGWKFRQNSGAVDEYVKDGVVVQLFHARNNNLTRSEFSDGKTNPVEIKDGRYKLEETLARMLGLAEAKPWYMSNAEIKALPPVGKGLGLIKTDAELLAASPVAETAPVEATSPDAKPVPKPAPRRKAPARKTG